MSKTIRTILLTLTMLIIFTLTVSADEIRVRVRSPRLENEYFTISADEELHLHYYRQGEDQKLFSLNSNFAHVRINGFYSSHENYRFYGTSQLSTDVGPYSLRLTDYNASQHDEILRTRDELNSQYNIKSYVYTDGTSYQLWAGQYLSQADARNARDKLKADHNINANLNELDNYIYLYNRSNGIIVCLSNDYRFFAYNSDAQKNYVNIDGKPYRGSVGFYVIEGNRLLSINKADVEDYLKGVVPSEMPASWHLEALKVQAIAARSYAISYIDSSYRSPYDVVDNQNSQVHSGMTGERESTNRAVDETRGQLIYYNNAVISAFYHSTSGGSTDNSENVWRYALPYIRGVDDPYSNISPYTDWNITLTEQELIVSLNENGYNVQAIYDIYVKSISEFNRVLELSLLTDAGEIILEKEETRTVIGYSKLRSTWYTFEGNNRTQVMTADGLKSASLGGQTVMRANQSNVILYKSNTDVLTDTGRYSTPTSADSYLVVGRGFGHSLGMSQYGARGMAEAGFNYIDIIKHYYTGVEVK
ncbi:MAG: SpoIID/LytB domain-containing protein [Eubacteriales bacterium]|nr:SpoIID/LytB domain-containing protein [Eubacteriales bacterium]